MKHTYTITDHRVLLMDTVESLIDLCDLYDQGKFMHSRFISVALRTMLHDTNASVSMFNHTQIKDSVQMVDTGVESNSDTSILISLVGGRYLIQPEIFNPLFISNSYPIIVPRFMLWYECHEYISFDTWWNKPIIIRNGKTYSRKKIITMTANKFGGAHVDSEIEKDFYELATNFESFAYVSEGRDNNGPTGEMNPINHSIYALVRQIAHEVLISLKQASYFDVFYNPDFSKPKMLLSDKRFCMEYSKTEEEMETIIANGEAFEH